MKTTMKNRWIAIAFISIIVLLLALVYRAYSYTRYTTVSGDMTTYNDGRVSFSFDNTKYRLKLSAYPTLITKRGDDKLLGRRVAFSIISYEEGMPDVIYESLTKGAKRRFCWYNEYCISIADSPFLDTEKTFSKKMYLHNTMHIRHLGELYAVCDTNQTVVFGTYVNLSKEIDFATRQQIIEEDLMYEAYREVIQSVKFVQ